MKPLTFRVKTFSGEVIIIEVAEYSKTTRAQSKKSVVLLDGFGSLSGGSIESVSPNWNGELGYKSDYKLTGGDLDDIPRARKTEYFDFMRETNEEITQLLGGTKRPELDGPDNLKLE